MNANLFRLLVTAFAYTDRTSRLAPECRRLVVGDDKNPDAVAWLWRSRKRAGRPLQSDEEFILHVKAWRHAEVVLRWIPMFHVRVRGSRWDQEIALWFLGQAPRITSGDHLYLDAQLSDDGQRSRKPSWDAATDEFIAVRCGKHTKNGCVEVRKPSDEMFEWVSDPACFLTTEEERSRVLDMMSAPDPRTGERKTIRRIFRQWTARRPQAQAVPALCTV